MPSGTMHVSHAGTAEQAHVASQATAPVPPVPLPLPVPPAPPVAEPPLPPAPPPPPLPALAAPAACTVTTPGGHTDTHPIRQVNYRICDLRLQRHAARVPYYAMLYTCTCASGVQQADEREQGQHENVRERLIMSTSMHDVSRRPTLGVSHCFPACA